MQAWRQEQQILASNAAGEEERRLSVWWKGEAEKLWDHESERRRSHAELAAHHEVQLTELEHQRTEVGLDRSSENYTQGKNIADWLGRAPRVCVPHKRLAAPTSLMIYQSKVRNSTKDEEFR